jgi:DNA relaxase NicK
MKKVKTRVHSCKVVAAGVDWMTCTATTPDARNELWLHGLRLVHAGQREGEPSSAWHANGYIGRKGPHFSFGARDDSVCLILSSFQAEDEWQHCIGASENVSRLDLAVDTHFDPPCPSLSRKVYRDACHTPSENGKPPKKTLYVDTDGGSTLYVGARPSENYGRLYDKGVKENVAPAGTWWRWEAELKGRVAAAQVDALIGTDDHRVAITLEVAHWFAKRTSNTYTSSCRLGTLVGSRQPTTVEKQLRWLASGVRPTVASLVERVGMERVLFALGLPSQSAVNAGGEADILKEA